MKCPICQQTELSGRQTYCSPACRKKASRLKVDIPTEEVVSAQHKGSESPEEWLARRMKETGSKKWHWINTGNPAGSSPPVKIPQLWELSDIKQAMSYRGRWMVDEATS